VDRPAGRTGAAMRAYSSLVGAMSAETAWLDSAACLWAGILDATQRRMPTPSEILQAAAAIANDWIVVAAAWHVAIALVLATFALRWTPAQHVMTGLVALLLVSVASFAAIYGNPFNATVFAILTVAILALGIRDGEACSLSTTWEGWLGGAMFLYAWSYPHFLEGSATQYLYAAPVGLLPCPTLSMTIALALLLGIGRPAQRFTLAAAGIAYAMYGAFRMGVLLDAGLFFGAAGLAYAASRDVFITPLLRRQLAR
jgi:hypothetical protein